MMIKIIDMHRW